MMKYSVRYDGYKNGNVSSMQEDYVISVSRPDKYIFLSEAISNIRTRHPEFDAIKIFGTDVRLWNDRD